MLDLFQSKNGLVDDLKCILMIEREREMDMAVSLCSAVSLQYEMTTSHNLLSSPIETCTECRGWYCVVKHFQVNIQEQIFRCVTTTFNHMNQHLLKQDLANDDRTSIS